MKWAILLPTEEQIVDKSHILILDKQISISRRL